MHVVARRPLPNPKLIPKIDWEKIFKMMYNNWMYQTNDVRYFLNDKNKTSIDVFVDNKSKQKIE